MVIGCISDKILISFPSPMDGGKDPFVERLKQDAMACANLENDFLNPGKSLSLRKLE